MYVSPCLVHLYLIPWKYPLLLYSLNSSLVRVMFFISDTIPSDPLNPEITILQHRNNCSGVITKSHESDLLMSSRRWALTNVGEVLRLGPLLKIYREKKPLLSFLLSRFAQIVKMKKSSQFSILGKLGE